MVWTKEKGKRIKLFNFIRKNEGTYFREMLRKTKIGNGQLQEELLIMESFGWIEPKIDGRRKRYYTTVSDKTKEPM